MSTKFAWPVMPTDQPQTPTSSPRAGLFRISSWAELLYVVLDLAPAIAFFALIVTLLAVGTGLAIIYVGVPIIALGLLVARFGGLVQRALALALLDMPTVAPGWAPPARTGAISALVAVLRDPAGWRAAAYFMVKIVLAPLTFGVAVGFYGYGLGAISYPLWRPFLPPQTASDGSFHRGAQWWPNFFVDSWPSMIVLAVLGLAVLWCAPRVVGFLTTFDRILIASLLSGRPAR